MITWAQTARTCLSHGGHEYGLNRRIDIPSFSGLLYNMKRAMVCHQMHTDGINK
ncbi:hypothetical protein I656_03288 [Geobacillus sp. WSUCF1]|nr:hypothetical protein I656_03288 [Geobacillus sp. WSUCF1]